MNETFGQRLQALRKSKGLSQDGLAEIVGVSRQAVSKWELNENQPDVDKVILLAQALGVTTDYLLLGAGPTDDSRRPAAEAPAGDPSHPVRKGMGRLQGMLQKHGYKAGYIMMAYGAVLVVLGLVFGFAFHSLFSFAESPDFGNYGDYTIEIDGNAPINEQELYKAIGSPYSSGPSGFEIAFYVVAGLFAVIGLALIIGGVGVAVKYRPKA